MRLKRNYISDIKIFVCLLFLGFIFSLSSQAQQDEFGWRISSGFGYTNYYGDLSNYGISWKNADNIFKLFHFNLKNSNGSSRNYSMLNSYSFSVERKWTNSLGIIAQYSNNIIYGNDRTDLNGNLDPSNPNFSRALNFKSNLNDFSLGIVFRADNNRILKSTSFLAPYITLTAGYTLFNTKADLYDIGGNPYNYLTDGTITGGIVPDGVYETPLQPLQTGAKKYESNTFNVGSGAGIRLRITSRIGIHIESTLRYTFTDQIDDVSGKYPVTFNNTKQEYASAPTGVVRTTRGSSKSNDMFVYNSISLRFNFGEPPKKMYRVPVFKSDSFLMPIEQPDTMTIKDSTVLVSNTTQDLSKKPDIKSTVSDTIPVTNENGKVDSAGRNHYEIRVIKKDSTRSRIKISIENGWINEIVIENSDAIITGDFAQKSKLAYFENDSLNLRPLVTGKIPVYYESHDSTAGLIREENVNKQIATENQLDEKLEEAARQNKNLQRSMDSLNTIILNQKKDFLQKIQEMETRASIQSDTIQRQSDKEKSQKELLELESEPVSDQKKADQDNINKPVLKESNSEDAVALNNLNEELNKKIEANAEENRALLEDNRNLANQIASQNKTFNDKLEQLQQQIQNNQIEADQKTRNYEEALQKIQEVNTLRSSQPELEPQLKEEFDKLFLQIQQYEKDQLITAKLDSAIIVKDKETTRLRDSLLRLQSEMKLMEEERAEMVNNTIEKPVDTLDFELIPVVEIYFEIGSMEVRETEESKIAQIAQLLVKYPDSKVILTGMADAIGNQDRNKELSLQRANAVMEILVNKYKVESTRIKVEAIGSSMSEGKTAFDRKVKMKIVKSF